MSGHFLEVAQVVPLLTEFFSSSQQGALFLESGNLGSHLDSSLLRWEEKMLPPSGLLQHFPGASSLESSAVQ